MLQLSQLPRKDLLVTGQFFAVHRSDSFTLDGFGFRFRDGRTIEPVTGRTCDRLHAAYGTDVTFIPADAETCDLVLEKALEYEPHTADALDKRFEKMGLRPAHQLEAFDKRMQAMGLRPAKQIHSRTVEKARPKESRTAKDAPLRETSTK